MSIITEVYEVEWPQEGWAARVFDTLEDAVDFAETKHGDLGLWKIVPNQNRWYPSEIGTRSATADQGPNIRLKTLTGQV